MSLAYKNSSSSACCRELNSFLLTIAIQVRVRVLYVKACKLLELLGGATSIAIILQFF